MINLVLHPLDLQLARPFGISRWTRTHQPTLVVELRYRGLRAWGEAAANPYYGVTVAAMATALEGVRTALSRWDPHHAPEEAWAAWAPQLGTCPAAQAALDIALHDLHAQLHGRPLYAHWGLAPAPVPQSSYTLSLGPLPDMLADLARHPWPLYKVKTGGPADLATLGALRQATAAPFRVDANAGWTAEQALDLLDALEALGVALVEQPLPPADAAGQARLFARSRLPLIADESCVTEADVDRCVGLFHGINIKLAKCGGLTPARRMIARARELGLLVMIGCMVETEIGITGLGHLLPLVDLADLDGALLLGARYAHGPGFVDGRLQLSRHPGIGAWLVSA